MNKISLIVAKGKNHEIGKDNELLWRIRDDLRLFKRTTHRHVVIHGRKSFESIGRPLPNRSNIVITRDKTYTAKGAFVVHSLEKAIDLANKLEQQGEIFILGGGQIYTLSMPLIDRMYISFVEAAFEDADAFFPAPDLSSWNLISSKEYPQNEDNQYAFDFRVYEK